MATSELLFIGMPLMIIKQKTRVGKMGAVELQLLTDYNVLQKPQTNSTVCLWQQQPNACNVFMKK